MSFPQKQSVTAIALFVCLAAIFCRSPLWAAAKSSISSPGDKVTVTTSKLRVVGTVGPAASGLLIRLNGSGPTAVTVTGAGETFFAPVHLRPGHNTIALTDAAGKVLDSRQVFLLTGRDADQAPADFSMFYLHSKGDLAENCEACHVPDSQFLEQMISCQTGACHQQYGKEKFVHGPMAEGYCIGCHTPHGSRYKNFLTDSQLKLCNSCHEMAGEYINRPHRHYPVEKGECITCHDPHESNLEFHLKSDSLLHLCMKCHGRHVTNHPVLHEPVAKGDCVACHDPHASDFKALLYEDKNAMCFTCHKVREAEFKRKFVHAPVAKDCGLCHDPHGSASRYQLRTARDGEGRYENGDHTLKDTCFQCHRKLDPKVVEQINNAPVKHKPVAEGKCTICHTPHSTNYQKQLNAPIAEICFRCHRTIQKIIDGAKVKHGPVNNNDCALCHAVHGGEHDHLLVASFTTKFSAEYNADNYRLCFNCHLEKVYENERSTATGFRNGTENLHYKHVNEKGKACKTCHEIHASKNDFHLRSKIPKGRRYAITMKFTRTETGGGCVVGCHKPKDYDRENPVANH